MEASTNGRSRLAPEHWDRLREAWHAGLVGAGYVGKAEHPGTALEAAEYDEWEIIAVSGRGEVLAKAEGRYYFICDDEDPRAVNVTNVVETFAKGITPAARSTPWTESAGK